MLKSRKQQDQQKKPKIDYKSVQTNSRAPEYFCKYYKICLKSTCSNKMRSLQPSPTPGSPQTAGHSQKTRYLGRSKAILRKRIVWKTQISQISLITQKFILASLREKRKHKVHGRFHNSGQSARCLYGRFTQVPKPAANLWGLGAP